jgi:hypothetical protein
MSHQVDQWQMAVLNILDQQRVSLLDLLQFTLRTRLPIHSHHCDTLRYHTSNIMRPNETRRRVDHKQRFRRVQRHQPNKHKPPHQVTPVAGGK